MAQLMPLTDETMIYDYKKHRYILTPKCVLDELNENLFERLNTRGCANVENLAQNVLEQISLQIYNFVYSHTSQRLFLQKVLAKSPTARELLKEAMKQQVLYFLINGQIDKYSGVDLRKGTAMAKEDLRGERAIDPQAITILQEILPETKVSMLYRGRYNSILTSPPDYEKEGY